MVHNRPEQYICFTWPRFEPKLFDTAYLREQCRLCSTHGAEPCRLCFSHGAETLFQGAKNAPYFHFCPFSKRVYQNPLFYLWVYITSINTFENKLILTESSFKAIFFYRTVRSFLSHLQCCHPVLYTERVLYLQNKYRTKQNNYRTICMYYRWFCIYRTITEPLAGSTV